MSEYAKCRDCEGRGFNDSDPDGKILLCELCNGTGVIVTDTISVTQPDIKFTWHHLEEV